jgi:indole-3-glycerol phosphate synthase
MGILEEIAGKKRQRLQFIKTRAPLRDLKARISDMKKPLDFKRAITRFEGSAIKLIAEIKKASPSRGVIREDFEPVGIAEIYQEKADAVSVLTEEDFFLGDLAYIKAVKEVTDRPLLRKDFIFDEYQIYESRAAGADAMLLIETLLERSQAEEYIRMAEELGLAVLFEVHDLAGLEKALIIGAGIIGINNRDLRTMKTDLQVTFELKKEIPGSATVVSESGVNTRYDVKRLEDAGVDAVLVGTALMESRDIGKRIDDLLRD